MRAPPAAARPVPVLVLDGEEYADPFADLFEPLPPDVEAGLRASVAEFGVLTPVSWCRTPTWGLTLVGGRNRVRVAADLGLRVPITCWGDVSDAAAEQMARDDNDFRRHRTPEAVRAARAGREQRSARIDTERELRAAGKSLRTIAKAVGVTAEQVRQDLGESAPRKPSDADSGVNSTPGGKSERSAATVVTGSDGKTYRQAPPAAPGPAQTTAAPRIGDVVAKLRDADAALTAFASPPGSPVRAAVEGGGTPMRVSYDGRAVTAPALAHLINFLEALS